MNKREMETILEDVQFEDWKFHVEEKAYIAREDMDGYDHHGSAPVRSLLYLQVRFDDVDNYTGATSPQSGRKWILSEHMTRSEVVTTAFKAVLTAVEHETREKFRYKGRTIFGPHFDVEALHSVARRVEVRKDPTSVARD